MTKSELTELYEGIAKKHAEEISFLRNLVHVREKDNERLADRLKDFHALADCIHANKMANEVIQDMLRARKRPRKKKGTK